MTNPKVEETDQEKSNNTIDSIVGWLKAMAVLFGLAILALLLIGFITKTNFDNERDKDKEQDTHQLELRLIEACHNYNRDKTIDRVAAHEKIIALAKLSGYTEIPPEVAARLPAFDARMAELYAYRNCSLDCVKAYAVSEVNDCPPSYNEEGT